MILNNNYKSIEIDITTYKREQQHKYTTVMNENITEKGQRKSNQNRFICSICLNKKTYQEENRNKECCKRTSKSCPICHKSCEPNNPKNLEQKGCKIKQDTVNNEKICKTSSEIKCINGKNTCMQTSEPDVSQGLTLLNEVLTVFQSKKQLDLKKNSGGKTVILKDASVETNISRTPKLSFSRTFLFSLGQNEPKQENERYFIINRQPETTKLSQFSIGLTKHKSSSIPQMKLEELKSSLKEKTKSKDAIEEVNRMFATVRKNEIRDNLDDSNRPMIRHGPRVLPVVKTNMHNCDNENQRQDLLNCRHCQTSFHMSSGDSFLQHGCFYKPDICDDSYVCCCHNRHRFMNPDAFERYCDTCKDANSSLTHKKDNRF